VVVDEVMEVEDVAKQLVISYLNFHFAGRYYFRRIFRLSQFLVRVQQIFLLVIMALMVLMLW